MSRWSRSFGPVVGALVLAAATLALPSRAVDANTSTWSVPVKVSGATRWTWFPAVAADDHGKVHVIWSAAYPTEDPVDLGGLFYTEGSAGVWTEPNDVGALWSGAATRSSIAVDSADRVHIVYKGFANLELPRGYDPPRVTGPEDLWYTSTMASSGQTVQAWLPPHQLTHNALGYYSDVAIDSQGVVHVVWTESDPLGWGLYYTRSTDGGVTWAPRLALEDRNFVWWYRAHLQIDGSDGLHVVWEVTDKDHLGRTRAAFYAHSADGGGTWAKVRMGGDVPQAGVASTAPAGPQQPAVGIDGSKQGVFVYRDETTDQIYYRTSPDSTRWSLPQRLPGVDRGIHRPYDVYDMATDNAGHVHLAFVGYPDGSETLSLMHSEWDGRAWSAPQIVYAGPAFPEYPKITISGGNRLHLVWFVGDRATIDRTPVGIYYSSAQLSAPHASNSALAVPLPTFESSTPLLVAPPPHIPHQSRPAEPLATGQSPSEGDSDLLVRFTTGSSFPLYAAVLSVVLLSVIVTAVSLSRSVR